MPEPTPQHLSNSSIEAAVEPAGQRPIFQRLRRLLGLEPSSRPLLLLVALIFLTSGAPAWADSGGANSGIELGLGVGFSHSDGDTDSDLTALALRGHRWFSDRWGFEGALSVTDEGIFDENYHYLDLSALYRLSENERFSTFLFGGVGAMEYSDEFLIINDNGNFDIVDRGSDTSATWHIGIGFDIAIGERFYFRPDLRHRQHLDVTDQADDSSFDATLGFGWRL